MSDMRRRVRLLPFGIDGEVLQKSKSSGSGVAEKVNSPPIAITSQNVNSTYEAIAVKFTFPFKTDKSASEDDMDAIEAALPQWKPRDEVDPFSVDEESLNVLCDTLVLELSVSPTPPQQLEKSEGSNPSPSLREYQQTMSMDSTKDDERQSILKFMRGGTYWRNVSPSVGVDTVALAPKVSQSL